MYKTKTANIKFTKNKTLAIILLAILATVLMIGSVLCLPKNLSAKAEGTLTVGAPTTVYSTVHEIATADTGDYAKVKFTGSTGSHPLKVSISNRTTEQKWLYMTFTADKAFNLMLGVNWDPSILANTAYTGGIMHTVKVDVSGVNTLSNEISVWLVSGENSGTTTIKIHELTFHTDATLPVPTLNWYVESTYATDITATAGGLTSAKIKVVKTDAYSALANTSFEANATAKKYIAVRYSGTATLYGLTLLGTKGGTASGKNGRLAVVASTGGQSFVSNTAGTGFTVFVGDLGALYGAGQWDIDTVTGIGFVVNGAVNDTFTIEGIEILADTNHSFGTPSTTTTTPEEPETPATPQITGWEIDDTKVLKVAEAEDHSTYSAKLKVATIDGDKNLDVISINCLNTYTVNETEHAYIAVKYKGTAKFSNIELYGTKAGGLVKHVNVGNVFNGGWNVKVKIGTDFSIAIVKVQTYYKDSSLDIDTVTKIGFYLKGNIDDTFEMLGLEIRADENHTLGTPTPPRGDMEVCDMKNGTANTFTIAKEENGVQTVSYDKYWGYSITVVNVKFWDSAKKWLYVEYESNANFKLGIGTSQTAADITGGAHPEQLANRRNKFSFDLSTLKTPFDSVDGNICFFFDAAETLNTAVGSTKTVRFYEISFNETDPNASTEVNKFRAPEGFHEVAVDGNKLKYTNTATDFYRYAEIKLDNHNVEFDVLSLKFTGYDGFVLGVRLLYLDSVEGGPLAKTSSDLIVSNSYVVKSAEQQELLFYLKEYKLDGLEIIGVQLYLDAPEKAGTVGEHEITLNEIKVLKSSDLVSVVTPTITADANVTMVFGGAQPNFHVQLMNGETPITGEDSKIIFGYRKGTTGNYQAGLPTEVGEYSIRISYIGSKDYKSCVKAEDSVLTITKASAVTANDGATFDATTRTVTVKEGHEASLSQTFEEGKEVVTGHKITAGTTVMVYFRATGDDNHDAGTVKNLSCVSPSLKLTDLEVNAEQATTTYQVNATVSIEGLVIKAVYDDGSKQDVTVTLAMLSGHDTSTVGEKTVTITYSEGEGSDKIEKTATYKINVTAAPILDSIRIATNPTKLNYFVGDTFSYTGIVVKYKMTDSETESDVTVTASMFSAPNMSTAGEKEVTVTYTLDGVTKTAKFKITVKVPDLTSLEIATQITKKSYVVGTPIDLAGLVVNAVYENGSKKPITVTTAMLSGHDTSTVGEKTVTVKYSEGEGEATIEKTVTFKITVIAAPVLDKIEIVTNPTKTVYIVGEKFNIAGLKVKGEKTDGTAVEIAVTESMVTVDMSKAGTVEVTITYTLEGVTKTVKFPITVNARSVTSIAITSQPTKKVYTVGEAIDLTGLKVEINYNDNTKGELTVTTAMLSGYDMQKGGNQIVTITHEGKTATFGITVNEVKVDKKGLGAVAIVFIILAVLVCLGGAGVGTWFFLKKKPQPKNPTQATDKPTDGEKPTEKKD